MSKLDEAYWSEKYQNESTQWDIGYPSTPLKTYIDHLKDRSIRILIPGAGNAYEAQYLWNHGFSNTTVIDLAKEPLDALSLREPRFPKEQLIQGDFFDHEGEYDLILEQTFFCALTPSLRSKYAQKMSELLAPNGKVVGVLFNFPLSEKGPPFGGEKAEYEKCFAEYLHVKSIEPCHISIAPRAGSELFFVLLPKQ